MSHYTVLVVANNVEELKKKMLPYHEYECTGIEEYLQFVPADMEEMEKYRQEIPIDEFMEAEGYKKNEEGVWGRITNPNKRWDWWVVGGRWRDLLTKRNGEKCDSAEIQELNINQLKAESEERIRERWRVWRNKPEGIDENEFVTYLFENGLMFVEEEEAKAFELDEDDYFNLVWNKEGGMTWAFLDENGEWVEKAMMGWFGQHYGDKNEGYGQKFWSYLESLDDEDIVWILDCHI